MTPYYEGTSEAEQLIRVTPELVEAWLKKAKHDRSRLATRLFQPQKKEFLDGFIHGLEWHLTQLSSHTSMGAAEPALADFDPAQISEASPDLATFVPESDEGRDTPDSIAPVVEADSPPIDTEPAAEFGNTEADCAVSQEGPAAEVANPPALDDVPAAEAETIGGHGEPRSKPAGYEPDTETEMAMGVMRISGWAVEPEPEPSGLSAQIGSESNPLLEDSMQTGQPVASVEWSRVFEQARGVGMVDLSAYDFIDGLGELRELIDRWHHLQQDASTVDEP